MNPRLVVTAVIALVAVLIFVGFLLERRKAVRKRRLRAAESKAAELQGILDGLKDVAEDGEGIDVTAERVKLRIEEYEQRHNNEESK